MARICIDISNIIPGKGGSGGGVVTYSKHIVEIFDTMDDINDEIFLLKHKDFKILPHPKQFKITEVSLNTKNLFVRLCFVQLFLPFFCLNKKIDLLYRVTPELPLIKVCKYSCTLLDFMFDFYRERPVLQQYLGLGGKVKFFFFRWITMHALKISDAVLVISNTLREETISKMKDSASKVFVTHPATDVHWVKEFLENNNSSILKIGVIAGFYPHKGHFRVLEMAKKMLESGFTDFSISFRGNPAFLNYQDSLKKYILDNKLDKHVYFVGYEPSATLADIYSSFDIFLLLSEYEGFGLPVLEAQAFNKPVFCSDIPILREVLGESAFYIDISSKSNELDIKTFLNVARNKESLLEMSKLGAENLKRFSWEKMCQEKYEVFKKILGQTSPRVIKNIETYDQVLIK